MYRSHRPSPEPVRVATPLFAALALTVLTAGPAAAGSHVVTVGDSFFSPNQLTIQAGDSVTWTKPATALPHNVLLPGGIICANGCSDTGGNGGPIFGAWSFTRTFNTPGTIDYRCQQHGFAMAGQLVVQGGAPTPGALRFSNGTYTAGEGSGQSTITVQRTGGDDGAVSVQYTTGNGSATAGNDYTASSGTLNWADNDDGSKTFTVPILEDSADEPNETVNLALASPTGGATLGSPSSAVLTITDNDTSGPGPSAGNLRFSVAAQDAPEAGGDRTVTVQRESGTAGTVSVQYASTGGTATAGDDYTAVSGILSWGGGDGAAKTFQLPILDDGDVEANETVTLALSAPTGGAGLGSPSTQTVTILDDDEEVEPGPCVEDGNALCLLGDRFRVRVMFTPPGGVEQPANAIPFTDRAGMFWFFNENNIEMLVKMQNACVAPFNRYWVFYAATTNVAFRVVVTDTEAGLPKRYSNPQGTVAPPVADTEAFATCP